MGRRTQSPALEFGSDSFLDVICNIVGILIILIVVVAVKVERQPLGETLTESAPAAPFIPDREAEYAQSQIDLDAMKRQYNQVTKRLQELADRKADLHREQLQVQEETEALKNQLAGQSAVSQRNQAAKSAEEQEASKLAADIDRLLNVLAGKEKALKNAITAIQQEEAVANQAEDTLRQSIVETVRLQELIDDTARPPDSTPRLVHRIMPVSRRTEGEEVMFRLVEGQISEVPLNELMKQAVDRVRKRISMLQRFGRLEDVVGPVSGYKMTFAIELNAFNSLEYLQYGGDGSKFNSFRQVIVPDPSLMPESVSDAVKPGSAFRQKLESMPADSSVTIVVYEDSFKEFAPLRELAHSLQIRVAARPLPLGTDITISANGSASRAQ